jgi:uncharacterized RDD family membrane protein YckC
MKLKFQPDPIDDRQDPKHSFVDPEAYDASEEQFAASLEKAETRPRFVLDENTQAIVNQVEQAARTDTVARTAAEEQSTHAASREATTDSWRDEVQAKISHYRARKRVRPPRYPSLQLKFEPAEPWTSERTASSEARRTEASPSSRQDAFPEQTEAPQDVPEETGKILEFPRPLVPPPPRPDELAEAIFDHPRILEVQDVIPPPPALGGILIEPDEGETARRQAALELPLRGAPMSRRLTASAIDGLIIGIAFAIFGYTFWRITRQVLPWKQVLMISAGVLASFWAGYQYLLLVYAGTTPGLKVAKLRLCRFDGARVSQRVRRWRVLASLLSGLSLALGYVWCFFDEDELCWHDRITHTYMAAVSSSPSSNPVLS